MPKANAMAVSYDQLSELRMAFEEAHVPAERRRSPRVTERVSLEIARWARGRAGRACGVTIEYFSTSGVAMTHAGRLKVRSEYLLEIPRLGAPPIGVVLAVVRCERTVGGLFSSEMRVTEVLAARDRASAGKRGRGSAGVVALVCVLAALAGGTTGLLWLKL